MQTLLGPARSVLIRKVCSEHNIINGRKYCINLIGGSLYRILIPRASQTLLTSKISWWNKDCGGSQEVVGGDALSLVSSAPIQIMQEGNHRSLVCNKQHYRHYNTYLMVWYILKGLVSHAPYLVHESSMRAPHVTGSRVLLVVQSLQQKLQACRKIEPRGTRVLCG